ncbi:hypothetical protein [Aliarcobacter faecis]|nr:hypothetical protein [Aliarcobacter faecis]
MNLEIINNISQFLILLNTLVLYPVFKFAFAIEKRLTILETKQK